MSTNLLLSLPTAHADNVLRQQNEGMLTQMTRSHAHHIATARLGTLCLVTLLGWPAALQAEWDSSADIVRGSAQVLEKGEIAVGVFAPLQYGLTDRLTLSSHPVLNLLQMVNFAARYRVATGEDWIVAGSGGLKYALLDPESTDKPVEFDLGAIATWLPHQSVALSMSVLYSLQRQRGQASVASIAGGTSAELAFHNGVAAVLSGHVVAHRRHLLTATIRVLRNVSVADWETPTATLAWVSSHSFFLGDVDIVLGASFGRFRVRDAVFFPTDDNNRDAETAWYPVFDIWKRF